MYGCHVSIQPCLSACYVMSDTCTYTHMHTHTRTACTHTHTHTHVPPTHTHTPADMLQCTSPTEKPTKYHKSPLGNRGPRTPTLVYRRHAALLPLQNAVVAGKC